MVGWFSFLITFCLSPTHLQNEGVIITLHEGWKYVPFPYLLRNKSNYANLHGYFLTNTPSHVVHENEHRTWLKPNMILNAMDQHPNASFFFWMDGDSIFTSSESIETRFETFFVSDFDMLVARDWNGMNAGMILMKNSTWVKDFWKEVDQSPHVGMFHEQSVAQNLYDANWNSAKKHIRMEESINKIQSRVRCPSSWNDCSAYKAESWIIHFPNHNVLELAWQIYVGSFYWASPVYLAGLGNTILLILLCAQLLSVCMILILVMFAGKKLCRMRQEYVGNLEKEHHV